MNLELFSIHEAVRSPDSNEHLEVNWDFIEHLEGVLGVVPNFFELVNGSIEFLLFFLDAIEVISSHLDLEGV